MLRTCFYLCGTVQKLVSLQGEGLSIWPKLTNLKFANGTYSLEGRMWMAFCKCLPRLQCLRWTGVLLAMPGTELPAKEHCSCPCHPSQAQRLWRAQEHSKILLPSLVNDCLC